MREHDGLNRADVFERARFGFEKTAGRGVVVVLSGVPDVRYASCAEINERLAEEQADPGFLAGVLFAVRPSSSSSRRTASS